MMRFICDLCGKDLSPGHHRRYVVKIEVFAAHDPHELTDADLGEDPMEELSEALADLDEGAEPEGPPPAAKKMRYDLCPHCHQKFVRDPLNKDTATKFDFSEN
jgi:hypothetical protein